MKQVKVSPTLVLKRELDRSRTMLDKLCKQRADSLGKYPTDEQRLDSQVFFSRAEDLMYFNSLVGALETALDATTQDGDTTKAVSCLRNSMDILVSDYLAYDKDFLPVKTSMKAVRFVLQNLDAWMSHGKESA